MKNPETGKYEMVPADEAAATRDGLNIVQGDFQPMVSPIDGAEIRTWRQYQDHCRKHNVVPAQEFNQEYFDR